MRWNLNHRGGRHRHTGKKKVMARGKGGRRGRRGRERTLVQKVGETPSGGRHRHKKKLRALGRFRGRRPSPSPRYDVAGRRECVKQKEAGVSGVSVRRNGLCRRGESGNRRGVLAVACDFGEMENNANYSELFAGVYFDNELLQNGIAKKIMFVLRRHY